MATLTTGFTRKQSRLLSWVKRTIDGINVESEQLSRFVVASIPAQCPFARKVSLNGKLLFEIPPLCKLNPAYDEVVFLRFRALSHLIDDLKYTTSDGAEVYDPEGKPLKAWPVEGLKCFR